MNNDVSMKSNPASSDLTSTSKTLVRMNGVMPDISTLGNSEKSERAAEVKRVNITANTSCSVLVSYGTTSSNKQVFHLLVDVGEGIIQSLEKTDLSSYPDFSRYYHKIFYRHGCQHTRRHTSNSFTQRPCKRAATCN